MTALLLNTPLPEHAPQTRNAIRIPIKIDLSNEGAAWTERVKRNHGSFTVGDRWGLWGVGYLIWPVALIMWGCARRSGSCACLLRLIVPPRDTPRRGPAAERSRSCHHAQNTFTSTHQSEIRDNQHHCLVSAVTPSTDLSLSLLYRSRCELTLRCARSLYAGHGSRASARRMLHLGSSPAPAPPGAMLSLSSRIPTAPSMISRTMSACRRSGTCWVSGSKTRRPL